MTLEPGGQASFVASWVPLAGPGSGDAGCSKGTALQVALPESKGKVKVDMLITACTGGTAQRVAHPARHRVGLTGPGVVLLHRATEVEPRAARIRARRVLALVASVLVISSLAAVEPAVAASKKKAEPERVTKSNACKVLTRKQIEAVLGGEATSTGTRREGRTSSATGR